MSGNIPQWQPGTTYVPGALVVPRSSAPPAFVDLTNKTLTATTGWDLASPLQILADGAGYGGQGRIACQGNSTGALALNQAHMPVVPGQTVSASCMCAHGTSNDHASDASVQIHWYNASNVEITPAAAGTGVPSLSNAGWQQISVSGTAPGGTAYARVGVAMNLSDFSTDTIQCSGFQVNYTVQVSPQATMYEATQATPGKSGSTEPTWPPEGSSVVDNQVTWNGVNIARLVWQASPLLTSGTTEPTWPTVAGGAVNDNGIDWICQIPNVKDTNCPNTPQVIILSSKVFAANNDITSFCATNNPLDWSTAQDAGFLPTGFQSVGETFATALGQYRGMLAVWTGSALELWQTDPDPAQMGLTDTFEGGGTSYYRAQASVSGDLFYLSPRGVRAVSVTAGSGNMEASTSAGLPVDTLVLPAIQGIQPLGIYYPGLGQYWLICGTEAFILTVDDAEGPSWSRYTFPTAITGATVLNGLLYLRDASNLYVLDEDTYQDNGQNIPVTVQWPWQDLDSPGVLKQLIGFDLVFQELPVMFATIGPLFEMSMFATIGPWTG